MRKLQDVQDGLKIERIKLASIIEKSHSADIELAAAEQEFEELKGAVVLDNELAVLDERKSDGALAKRLPAAEKRLSDARALGAAVEGALKRQQAKVDNLQAEIDSRKLEAFRLDLGNAPAELLDLLDRLSAKAAHIDNITRKHGRNGQELTFELFPNNPADVYDGLQYRLSAVAIFNNALLLAANKPARIKAAA